MNVSPMFRKRGALIAGAALGFFAISVLFIQHSPRSMVWLSQPETHAAKTKAINLKGAPTENFRDNLLDDQKYITTWAFAGWTNNVMSYINMIYLGMLSDRIPILSPFYASQHTPDAPILPFSEVFDVQRLSDLIGVEVLEWDDVKDPMSEHVDPIGCWSTVKAQFGADPPHSIYGAEMQKLDISFTNAPMWIKKFDYWTTFGDLDRLAFPFSRKQDLTPPIPSPLGVSLPPDEQLLCFDAMYFVCDAEPFDYPFDYIPQWRHAGQHLHWTPRLERLGQIYVNHALGLSQYEATPPYIVIHMRHGDFAQNVCGDWSLRDCFPSMAAISKRVEEVQKELMETQQLAVHHVVMTSDEKDEEWWSNVTEKGWVRIDHSHTVEDHGHWYPTLIDAVIQSGGIGFIGTDMSTMSTIARRRAESWHGAVSRTMLWGYPTADDH